MNHTTFADYVFDLLAPLGTLKIRKMFGGYGIYKDNIFFALIAENILYFKVAENNYSTYESYGSKPFSYERENKTVTLKNYWQVPVDILENQEKCIAWAEIAVKTAQQGKKRT
jgi:DNA transformation protein and related proteins